MKGSIANLHERIATACAGFIECALIFALSRAVVARRPDVPKHARKDLARLVLQHLQTGLTNAIVLLDHFKGADAKSLYFGPKNDDGTHRDAEKIITNQTAVDYPKPAARCDEHTNTP